MLGLAEISCLAVLVSLASIATGAARIAINATTPV